MQATINTAEATIAAMLAFYNEHAPEPRKSFKDRATAIKACETLQANLASAAMASAAMERAAASAAAATAEESPVAEPEVIVPDTVVVQQIPAGKSGKARKNKPGATQRTPEQEALRAARFPVATLQERTMQTSAGATVRIRPAVTGDSAAQPSSGNTTKPAIGAKPAPQQNNAVITLLQPVNPKRGASALRYALYRTGMTIAEYCAAGGVKADIAWDIQRGFISVA